jgi:hypothetical protein
MQIRIIVDIFMKDPVLHFKFLEEHRESKLAVGAKLVYTGVCLSGQCVQAS